MKEHRGYGRMVRGWCTGRLVLACVATAHPAVGLAATTDVSIDVIAGNPTLVVGASFGGGTVNKIGVNLTSNNTKYTVTEGPNSTIVAGPGCTKRPAQNIVDCNAAGVTRAQVSLWDGADEFEHNTQLFTTVFGGSEGDKITTGCGADIVFGDGGNDTIIDQGLCGGFNLNCDTSVSPPFKNCLNGGPGIDTIKGPLGNVRDRISGDGDRDELFGRGGDDLLLSRDGVSGETVDCGSGSNDVAQWDAGDAHPGCEVPQ